MTRVAALAAFDFDELLEQRPGAPVQVVGNCLALGVQAEAAAPLPFGRDSVVGDERTLGHGLSPH
jgi:hypothetical protein